MWPGAIPAQAGAARNATDVTGARSSYWYNGFIHETNIGEGLNIFRLSSMRTAGAIKLGHLNPPTQEFSLPE